MTAATASQRSARLAIRAAPSSPPIASAPVPTAYQARSEAVGSSIAIQCSAPNVASARKVTPRANANGSCGPLGRSERTRPALVGRGAAQRRRRSAQGADAGAHVVPAPTVAISAALPVRAAT